MSDWPTDDGSPCSYCDSPASLRRTGYLGDPAISFCYTCGNSPRRVATVDVAAVIERLKADLAYHQEQAAEITRECLDIDTADEGMYTIEADCAESYHAGRVAALSDAIGLLLGQDVKLYSETEERAAQ
jgi:hypothetical protein